MGRRVIIVVLVLSLGIAIGVGVTLLVQSSGWLLPIAPGSDEAFRLATTDFIRDFSPEESAKRALPKARWTVVGSTHQTSISEGGFDRHGATIRYSVIRNTANHPLTVREQEALQQALLDDMEKAVRATGATVFDSVPREFNHTEIVMRPPGVPNAKAHVRPLTGFRFGYRSLKVEGRVFGYLTGEQDEAVTLVLVIVEQPSGDVPRYRSP